jgi:hypothetical protein
MERLERIGPRHQGPGGVAEVTGPLRVEPRDRDAEREEGARQSRRRRPRRPEPPPPAAPGHVDLLA